MADFFGEINETYPTLPLNMNYDGPAEITNIAIEKNEQNQIQNIRIKMILKSETAAFEYHDKWSAKYLSIGAYRDKSGLIIGNILKTNLTAEDFGQVLDAYNKATCDDFTKLIQLCCIADDCLKDYKKLTVPIKIYHDGKYQKLIYFPNGNRK